MLPMQLLTTEGQLGASYVNNQSQHVVHNDSNISVCSSDSEAQENLKSLFNERPNNKFYTTFNELFFNANTDSVCEILPIVSIYNNQIARFVEDINVKYRISLNYTQLEVSEIHDWAETFQASAISSSQPGP